MNEGCEQLLTRWWREAWEGSERERSGGRGRVRTLAIVCGRKGNPTLGPVPSFVLKMSSISLLHAAISIGPNHLPKS